MKLLGSLIICFTLFIGSFSAQSTLWGIGEKGIFEFNPVTGAFVDRYIFPTNTAEGANPADGMYKASNGMLYYCMKTGGNYGKGTVNKYNPATNQNTVLAHFDGTNGESPNGKLTEATNGKLYGTTASKSSSVYGTVFTIGVGNDAFSADIFTYGSPDQREPRGQLLYDTINETLYGLSDGVQNSYITKKRVLIYDIATNTVTHSDTLPYPHFTVNTQHSTDYGLTLAADGNYYGTVWEKQWTSHPNHQSMIHVFSYNPTTGEILKKGYEHHYGSSSSDNFKSSGRLIAHPNGKLYGLYANQGPNNPVEGYLFSHDPTNSITIVKTFDGSVGLGEPVTNTSLTLTDDGKLYGYNTTLGNSALFYFDPTAPVFSNFESYEFPGGFPITNPIGDMVELAAPPSISSHPNNVTVCEGINTSLLVTAVGADTYQWYLEGNMINGENSATININNPTSADAGYYYCEVINQTGSTDSDSALVTINPLPPVVANATPSAICEGDTLLLLGTGADSYTWDNSVLNGFPFVPTMGITYTVTGIDGNGCVNTASVNMPIHTIGLSFIEDTVFCGGVLSNNITGDGSSYTYEWNPDTDLSCTNCAEPSASPNILTDYHLSIEDENGCSATDSIVVNILAIPTDICVVSVDQTSTKNVLVWEKPISQAIDSFRVYRDVVGTYQYVVSISYDSLSTFTDTSAGVNPNSTQYRYKISAVDTCGVESPMSAYHQTIHLNIPIFSGNTADLVWQAYDGFPNNYYYRILRDSLSNTDWEVIDSVSSTTLVYTDVDVPSTVSSTRYLIEIAFNGTCSVTKAQDHNSTRSNQSTITGVPIPDYINEASIENVVIYPNPTNGIFYVVTGRVNWSYQLLDISGKLIDSKEIGKNTAVVDISNLESGIYIISATINGYSIQKRIIKE